MDILASDNNLQQPKMYIDENIKSNIVSSPVTDSMADSLLLLGLNVDRIGMESSFGVDSESTAPQPHHRENLDNLKPIVDIKVIKTNEKPLQGHYQVLSKSYMGSDIFGKSFFFRKTNNSIVCFRTGEDKLPIIDIKLVNYNESVPAGYTVIVQTDNGNDACLNHSHIGENSLYLAYKRATYSPKFAIVDLCIVRVDNKESFPHTYFKVEPKISTGLAMLSPSFQFVFKRSRIRSSLLSYRAEVLSYYPTPYMSMCLPDISTLSKFCLPDGIIFDVAVVGSVPTVELFTTSLTDPIGNKVYATCYIFYEILEETDVPGALKCVLDKARTDDAASVLFTTKCLCLLSKEPNFKLNHHFLSTLHRFTLSPSQHIPIERFLLALTDSYLFALTPSEVLHNPFDGLIPKNGASFLLILSLFEVEELIDLVVCVLLERKVLVHCHKVNRIMPIVECLSMIIYPFEWQCPYIPFCPLDLADVITAPMPFIAGISTEYFDHNIPGEDITCIDLSNDHIRFGNEIVLQIPDIFEVLRENLYFLKQLITTEYEKNENFIETMDNKTKMIWELNIQYEFIKFICSLMSNYRKFLRVSTISGKSPNDVTNIFDVKGFIHSKNTGDRNFFLHITKTQYFSNFITQCYKHYKCELGMTSIDSIVFLNDFIDNMHKSMMNKRWLHSKINLLDEKSIVVYPEISFFNYDYGHSFTYGSYFPKFDQNLLSMEEKIMLELNPPDLGANNEIARHKNGEPKINFFRYEPENTLLKLPLKSQYIQLVVRNGMEKEKSYQKALNAFNDCTKLCWPSVVLNHVYCCWFICLMPMYHYCTIVINDKVDIFGNEILISVVNELTKYSLYNLRKMGKLGCITSNEIYPRIIAKLCSFSSTSELCKKTWNYMNDHGIPMDTITTTLFDYTMKRNSEHRKKQEDFSFVDSGQSVSANKLDIAKSVKETPNHILHKKSCSASPGDFVRLPKTDFSGKLTDFQPHQNHHPTGSDLESTLEDSTTSEGLHKIFNSITLNDFSSIDIHHDNATSKTPSNSSDSINQYADPQKWFMSLSGVNKFIDLDVLDSGNLPKNFFNENHDFDIDDIASGKKVHTECNNAHDEHGSVSDKNLYVHMSCCMECQFCGHALFDEDIMCGWSFNDSNFNFICPFCPDRKSFQTANIHIRIYETMNIPNTAASSNHAINQNTNDAIEFGDHADLNNNTIAVKSVVYVSPMTLRKEIECTIEQNGINFLMSPSFPEKYPLIFWNLLWFFKRKSLKTHLTLLLTTHLKRSNKAKITIFTSWECPFDEMNNNRPLKILLSSMQCVSSICNENPTDFIEKTLHSITQLTGDDSIKKTLKSLYSIMQHQSHHDIPILWNLYSETLHILDVVRGESSEILDISQYERVYASFYEKYSVKDANLKKYMEPSCFCAVKFRKLLGPLHVKNKPPSIN